MRYVPLVLVALWLFGAARIAMNPKQEMRRVLTHVQFEIARQGQLSLEDAGHVGMRALRNYGYLFAVVCSVTWPITKMLDYLIVPIRSLLKGYRIPRAVDLFFRWFRMLMHVAYGGHPPASRLTAGAMQHRMRAQGVLPTHVVGHNWYTFNPTNIGLFNCDTCNAVIDKSGGYARYIPQNDSLMLFERCRCVSCMFDYVDEALDPTSTAPVRPVAWARGPR